MMEGSKMSRQPNQPDRAASKGDPFSKSQSGQALAEMAVISVVAILLIFGTLSLIVLHRARSAAISAAYACAQFLSQSPEPLQAARQAINIANQTIQADWSGLVRVSFRVEVAAPAGAGNAGSCSVYYNAPFLYNGLFGIPDEWSAESFFSRSEAWKADW
jgi:Flp pilus assembly protein TadG